MKALLAVVLILPFTLHASPLMLAKKHHDDIEVSQYLVSEKLDGVRARWTGLQLETRNGNLIHAPSWFTAPLPDTMLDGELWIGRGKFQAVTQVVLDHKPNEQQWKAVKYMVFDLPEHPGPFSERAIDLAEIVAQTNAPHLNTVEQTRFNYRHELFKKLGEIEALGGEGLMLHHCENLYKNGRSAGLLKLKSFDDSEATVIAHHPGKGKFTDMLGALEVETDTGIRFKLGSGFSNEERRQPPAIGSLVTYKHYGFTQSGKPRFASYLRLRANQ